MAVKKKTTGSKTVKKGKGGKADAVTQFIDGLGGDGILGDLTKTLDFISTGSWIIDRLIGDGTATGAPGGIPRGFMTEIFGEESCGKTTLALHCAREVQREGGIILFADWEHSLRAQVHYMKNMGIDLDPRKFIVMQPNSFEEGAEKISEAVITIQPDLVIIDSVTAMLPQAVLDGGAGALAQIGLHARLTSAFLNYINKYLEKYNTAMILLNQVRSRIKKDKFDFGPDEVTSGGKAIRFFPHLRIEMKPSKKEVVDSTDDLTGAKTKKVINRTIKVTPVKNKIDIPFRSAPVYMAFGKGIDGVKSLIETAVNKRVIKAAGAWYSYSDPNNEAYNFKVCGKSAISEHLAKHPEVLKAMMPFCMPEVDTEAFEEASAAGEVDSDDISHLSSDQKKDLEGLSMLKSSQSAISEDLSGLLED